MLTDKLRGVLFQYFFNSLGEVLVSISGYEYAYSQAPPNMKNIVAGIVRISDRSWGHQAKIGGPDDANVDGLLFVVCMRSGSSSRPVARWS